MEDYLINRCYVGSELKLLLTIDADGFDIDNDDWTVTIRRGTNVKTFTKESNTVRDSEGAWYLLLDTKEMGPGLYVMITDVDIPDTDFPDGLRHETYKQELFKVYGV